MGVKRIHIVQGELATSASSDVVITTLLGSCVSCCLWDPVAKVGGMNHMLLTVRSARNSVGNLLGINAMELLINSVIKLGATRDNLRAKAFGGSSMVAGLSDIGRENAEFTLRYLEKEEIYCENHSFGGSCARNLRFWPTTGRVQQRLASDAQTDDRLLMSSGATDGNGLELF